MGDILFTIILIVSIICYTVYKIDCNHVNKHKNNYHTGGLTRTDYESKSPDPAQWVDNYRSISKPVPNRNKAIPPRKDSE